MQLKPTALMDSWQTALAREVLKMAKLQYHKDKPYFSTLTGRYYASYDAAFQESLRNGGGAYIDFNLYLVYGNGTAEIIY